MSCDTRAPRHLTVIEVVVEFRFHNGHEPRGEGRRRFRGEALLAQDGLAHRVPEQVGQLQPGDVGGLVFDLELFSGERLLKSSGR